MMANGSNYILDIEKIINSFGELDEKGYYIDDKKWNMKNIIDLYIVEYYQNKNLTWQDLTWQDIIIYLYGELMLEKGLRFGTNDYELYYKFMEVKNKIIPSKILDVILQNKEDIIFYYCQRIYFQDQGEKEKSSFEKYFKCIPSFDEKCLKPISEYKKEIVQIKRLIENEKLVRKIKSLSKEELVDFLIKSEYSYDSEIEEIVKQKIELEEKLKEREKIISPYVSDLSIDDKYSKIKEQIDSIAEEQKKLEIEKEEKVKQYSYKTEDSIKKDVIDKKQIISIEDTKDVFNLNEDKGKDSSSIVDNKIMELSNLMKLYNEINLCIDFNEWLNSDEHVTFKNSVCQIINMRNELTSLTSKKNTLETEKKTLEEKIDEIKKTYESLSGVKKLFKKGPDISKNDLSRINTINDELGKLQKDREEIYNIILENEIKLKKIKDSSENSKYFERYLSEIRRQKIISYGLYGGVTINTNSYEDLSSRTLNVIIPNMRNVQNLIQQFNHNSFGLQYDKVSIEQMESLISKYQKTKGIVSKVLGVYDEESVKKAIDLVDDSTMMSDEEFEEVMKKRGR